MTKLKIIFPIVVVLLLCTNYAQAQWEAPFSRFWTVKTYYNPSFAGETDKIEASGIYKWQWMGIENAPKHIFVSANMPVEFLGKQHGVGVLNHSATVGNERNTLTSAQYAYKHKMGGTTLSVGIQAGMLQLNFDAASVRLFTDSTKNNRRAIKANPTDKKTIDLSAGISLTSKNFFAGMGAMHLNQPTFLSVSDSTVSSSAKKDSTLSRIPLSYNFMAGCNISVFHPLIEIQPMVLVQTNLADTRLQTALQLVYDKKYSAGASWRGNQGYSFFAGAVIHDIQVGYAYDLHASGIGKESGGSHEISVRYRFPIELWSKKPKAYKSIRLL